MTKRKFLSIFYYHLGHNTDRLLWMISPTNDWVGDKHHQALLEVGLNTILERFVKSTFADDKCQK